MSITSSSLNRCLVSLSVSLCAFVLFSSQPARGCSNVGLAGNGYAVTARTMDLPVNVGNVFAMGRVGDKNTTDLTAISGDKEINALSWVTEHNFVGQTWRGTSVLAEGLNDEGLYAAYLYLEHFTKYPEYNPADPRPATGVLDVVNYLLGTADSVSDVLERPGKVQVIKSAVPAMVPGKEGFFTTVPVHLVLRDKSGKSAVVEWVKGEQVIYPDSGPVITNSPPFGWQTIYAQQYDYVTNWTEFAGIPGSWSPPNRFARAYQLVKHSPVPDSNAAALRTFLNVLESIQVPVGADTWPTGWKTLVDLNNLIYYFQPMYDFIDIEKDKMVAYNPVTSWVTVDLNKVVLGGELPKEWISAAITPTPKGACKELLDLVSDPDAILKLK